MNAQENVNIAKQREASRLLSERLKTRRRKDVCLLPLWGNLPLEVVPDRSAHCCCIGADETARSITFHRLLASVGNARCLAFDSDSDLVAFIKRVSPKATLFILNPFDKRAVAWDIAGDANTPDRRSLLASLLVPVNPDETDHAIDAQRAIVAAAMEVLHNKAPGEWTLLQLLAALHPAAVAPVLSEYPSTQAVVTQYLESSAYGRSMLLESLHSKLQPFYPIASIWQHAAEKISVRSWAESESILILGNDEPHRQGLAPLNRLLLHLFCMTPLSPLRFPYQKTWLFLPNLEDTPVVDFLPQLLADGAKAGFNVYVDMRDLQFLHRHYGGQTLKVIDQCDNFAFFRITDGATARWASEKIAAWQRDLPGNAEARLPPPVIPPMAFEKLRESDAKAIPDGYLGQYLLPFYRTRSIKEPTRVFGPKRRFWSRRSAEQVPGFVPRDEEDEQFPQDSEYLLAQMGFSEIQKKRSVAARSRAAILESYSGFPIMLLRLSTVTERPSKPPCPPPPKEPPPPPPESSGDFKLDDFPRLDVG